MKEYCIKFVNFDNKIETIIVPAVTHKDALTTFERIVSYKQFIDCKLNKK